MVPSLNHPNRASCAVSAVRLALVSIAVSMVVALGLSTGGVARADDPSDPPTSESTLPPTTEPPTTAAPTTAPPTTAVPNPTPPTSATPTTRRPTPTTKAPATTTTEPSTDTSESENVATTSESTTTAPAVVAPETTTTAVKRPNPSASTGMSTGMKLAVVVGGLAGVGMLIGALTVAYWRHTRPVHYLDALDVLDLIVGTDLNSTDGSDDAKATKSRDDMSWLEPTPGKSIGDDGAVGAGEPASMPIVTLEDLFGEGSAVEVDADSVGVDADGLWRGVGFDVTPGDSAQGPHERDPAGG